MSGKRRSRRICDPDIRVVVAKPHEGGGIDPIFSERGAVYIDAPQRAEFDKRRTRRHMGLNLFKGNLQRWTQGQFVRAEWWDPPAGWRELDSAQSPNLAKNTPAQRNQADQPNHKKTETELPARVAIGLVYVESMRGFGYHMWTETYVDGHWAALDATLAGGGIGPAHLKLAHSNLQGGSAFSCFLPVANVLGRLEIEVIEIE